LHLFYLPSASQNVKNFNKHALVDLIRFAGRGVARTDIAQELGLTRASVTIIINNLIESGIILETESRATLTGARPPEHGSKVIAFESQPCTALVVSTSSCKIVRIVAGAG